MLPDYQIKILMLMHELENTLGDLYTLFAERVPEHSDLWNTLTKEELEHAEAVRTLYKLTYEGESYFEEDKIKPEAIQSIIDRVKDACDRAKQEMFTAEQALTLTYDLESSLIAKNTFRCFDVSPKFDRMLEHLRGDSEHHAQLAKYELDKIRKG
jgi:hypothetical protein